MNTDGSEILMRWAGFLPAGEQGEVSERTGRCGMSYWSILGVQLTQIGQQRTGYILAAQLKSQTTRVLS